MSSACRWVVASLSLWLLAMACGDGRPPVTSSRCGQHCVPRAEFCDPVDDGCLLLNGKCSTKGDCPQLNYPPGVIDVDCVDGFCRAARTSTTPTWLRELSGRRITITSPSSKVPQPSMGLELVWQAVDSAVLVYVLDSIPASLPEFEAATKWAASVPRGGENKVAWREGSTVENGEWLTSIPEPPEPGIYYAIVVGVDVNRVIAISDLSAFSVGDEPAWKDVGDPCNGGSIPGECDRPDAPLACYRYENICALICASHRECPSGSKCQQPYPVGPTAYARFCLPDDALPDPGPDWTCAAAQFGTGDGCDCGCGKPDPDCADSSSSSCATCGCLASQVCAEDDPTQCADEP
jgi:hypothetical protein